MILDEVVRPVFTALGALVAAGGGGALIAWGIFRQLGGGWLDQRFKKQLETLKHEQQRELEHLRHAINSEFSRISKVHQKEFEVLPEAWRLLHVAHGRAPDLVGRLKFYPLIEDMSEPQFDEFLETCSLSPVQKNELRNSPNRRTYYRDAIHWIELGNASTSQIELGKIGRASCRERV